MNYILLIIVGLAGIALGYYFSRRGKSGSLGEAHEAIQARKERSKEKILEYLKTHKKVANNDVEKLLGVSDATAERYLGELEQEGRVVRHGEGRGVFYIQKSPQTAV